MVYSYGIGIVAGVFFVVAYGALNFGLVGSTSPFYQSLNFLGAIGFTYTAIRPFNPGLFILEVIWAAVALYGLWKIWTKRSEPDTETTALNAEA
ncbi:MAG: transporter [Ornithinimicrobium sp.]|uniref:CBU_0592 family membrane protein n=1 Tax=Ornithinimicrobium sp. TaxID=1977084 RepID=UPI0026DF732F|nr:transporter [Ornithinimicrobium sp.]MDO5740820.1 transporter [Ornithinimicrobium sp.]